VTAAEDEFWVLADPLLEDPAVTRSTMMGLPCLRVEGAFFASYDRRAGNLLVKLPARRVDQLVSDGTGHEFAPAGKRFREWAAISPDRRQSWAPLLAEALAFVSRTG
jgi:hypothetical protein